MYIVICLYSQSHDHMKTFVRKTMISFFSEVKFFFFFNLLTKRHAK